ncbi:MAG: acyltransferase [Calditrichaeota bacterium]|nr:MAG: acyltransferase [Calditrichota bacterium]
MRKLIKGCILAFFFIITLPAGLLANIPFWLFKSQLMFALFGELFSNLPGFIGVYCRMCFYKMTLAESHLDVYFAFGSIITKKGTRLEHRVGIGGRTIIGLADIGHDTIIANTVSLLSGAKQHNFDNTKSTVADGTNIFQRMTIGPNVFIGDQSIIMADIGEKTIIGAGAVVVKDIPPYSIAVGNPAKVVKERPRV